MNGYSVDLPHRALLTVAFTVAVLGLAGCASHPALRPAEAARGNGEGVADTSASVMVVAQSENWAGSPNPIEGYQPVHVRIENRGDHPVRLRYQDFQLAIGDSTRSPADPRAIEGRSYTTAYGHEDASYGRYARRGFHIAPHHAELIDRAPNAYTAGYGHPHRFGHGFHSGFGYGFGYGFRGVHYGGYRHGGPHAREVELPSRDMLLAAIPEGVLEPGGRLEGFLYYPDLSQAAAEGEETQPTTLTLAVVHAETNESLGRASLPFVYEH